MEIQQIIVGQIFINHKFHCPIWQIGILQVAILHYTLIPGDLDSIYHLFGKIQIFWILLSLIEQKERMDCLKLMVKGGVIIPACRVMIVLSRS